MPIPEGAQFCIRDVWQGNLHIEFAHLSKLKDEFFNISIDTEFPGVVFSLPFPAAGLHDDELRYYALKSNVDNTKLIQLGITLTDDRGNLPIIDGMHCVWQFNFRDFEIAKDMYVPDSIDLLVRSGIDFEKNSRYGVDAGVFGKNLLRYKLVCNNKMRYICFAGDYDFAYLLKILTGGELPLSKVEYDKTVDRYFGTVLDLKEMQTEHLLIRRGGLQNLADVLGVKRIGIAHQAGSDSLLTSLSFQKLKEMYLDKLRNCRSPLCQYI